MNKKKLLTDEEITRIKLIDPFSRKAALTGIAGARAMGLPTLSPVTLLDLTLPFGVSPPPRSQWRQGIRFLRSSKHSKPYISDQGFPIVGLPQILLHMQRAYGTLETLVAVDSTRRVYHPYAREDIHASLIPFSGARGIRDLRKTVDLSESTMDSPMESLARFRLIDAKLPQVKSVEYQAQIQVIDGRGHGHTFYADQLINGYLISELDGKTKYNGTYGDIPEEVRQKERDRERILLNAGYPLIRNYYSALRLDPNGSCAYVRSIQQALKRYPQPAKPPARMVWL